MSNMIENQKTGPQRKWLRSLRGKWWSLIVYSKRWYLVHLLGGKCRDCNDANFYNLEIHHRFEDGDGERKYYTRMDKSYLDRPKRAKERLEVLCKRCHENAHHPKTVTFIPKTIQKHRIFMDVLKNLEGSLRKPVREDTLILTLLRKDFTHDEAKQYIRRMIREASIYESKVLHYNRV